MVQARSFGFVVSIEQSHVWCLSRDGGGGCYEGKVDGSRRETRKLLRRSRGGTMVAWIRKLAVAGGFRWRQQGFLIEGKECRQANLVSRVLAHCSFTWPRLVLPSPFWKLFFPFTSMPTSSPVLPPPPLTQPPSSTNIDSILFSSCHNAT